MLYETLNQPIIFLSFLILGLFCGLIFDFGNFIKFLFSNKKLPSIIIDIIQTFIILYLLFLFNLIINYGQIRLFIILVFTFSFIIERYIVGKFVAKFYIKCYNVIVNINKKLWSQNKNDKTNKTN